jgi:hypothetical protein
MPPPPQRHNGAPSKPHGNGVAGVDGSFSFVDRDVTGGFFQAHQLPPPPKQPTPPPPHQQRHSAIPSKPHGNGVAAVGGSSGFVEQDVTGDFFNTHHLQ